MFRWLNINNKNISIIAIGAWLILGFLYCQHTPIGHRNHDFYGHIEYTKIIATQHRLPLPHEGWQTYHPPLYYLINNFIGPSIVTSEENHINFVRALSVIYGAIFLWFIAWFLENFSLSPQSKLLSLLFIATIPKFSITFSTYNNDSLATLFAVSILTISYKLYQNWSNKLAICLLAVTTLAFYTKYTAFLCIFVLVIICLRRLLNFKLPNLKETKILGVIALSVVLFIPYIYIHNFKHTGKIFPGNAEQGLGMNLAISDDRSILSTVLRIPALQQDSNEWNDPWAHGYTRPETKKHDYWAFSFLTSIYGEVVYEKPGIGLFWILIWIHLACILLALTIVMKSVVTRLAGTAILLGHLSQIILMLKTILPGACTMDYRYICWLWVFWALLYSHVLDERNMFSFLFNRIIVVGIVVQIYILLTMTGNAS